MSKTFIIKVNYKEAADIIEAWMDEAHFGKRWMYLSKCTTDISNRPYYFIEVLDTSNRFEEWFTLKAETIGSVTGGYELYAKI